MKSFTPLPDNRPRAPRAKGFTLVELMVTVVIGAILISIAIPAYSSYVLKSHRTDAKSALVDLASLEERYFSTQNTYTSVPSQLGYTGGAPPFTVGSGYYQITNITTTLPIAPTSSTTVGTPATYTITATAYGSQQQQDTQCYTFTINSAGTQAAYTSASVLNTAACWTQ
jgi:type IV pilus assembly protein PilE